MNNTRNLTTALALALVGVGTAQAAMVVGLSTRNQLVTFDSATPQMLMSARFVSGMAANEALVGIDYRPATGQLYGLGSFGRLYTLNAMTGAASLVATLTDSVTGSNILLDGVEFGFDFNPTVDRIRLVSNTGQNLRLHPDTGAAVDGDPAVEGVQPDPSLRYAWADVNARRKPDIAGAAYTYNPNDSKITTNYAIDRALGVLVMQGSREGTTPVVSPNTGQLRTVGSLGLGPLTDVAFDIADVGNTALIAVRTAADNQTRLHQVDLATGATRPLGLLGEGTPLVGMAIEP